MTPGLIQPPLEPMKAKPIITLLVKLLVSGGLLLIFCREFIPTFSAYLCDGELLVDRARAGHLSVLPKRLVPRVGPALARPLGSRPVHNLLNITCWNVLQFVRAGTVAASHADSLPLARSRIPAMGAL